MASEKVVGLCEEGGGGGAGYGLHPRAGVVGAASERKQARRVELATEVAALGRAQVAALGHRRVGVHFPAILVEAAEYVDRLGVPLRSGGLE